MNQVQLLYCSSLLSALFLYNFTLFLYNFTRQILNAGLHALVRVCVCVLCCGIHVHMHVQACIIIFKDMFFVCFPSDWSVLHKHAHFWTVFRCMTNITAMPVRLRSRVPLYLVITGNLGEDLWELRQLAELHQVQPGHIRDPLLGLGLHRVQVQRSTTWGRETTGVSQ